VPKIPLYPSSVAPNDDDLLILEDSVTSNTKKIKRSDLLGGNTITATNDIKTDAITGITDADSGDIYGITVTNGILQGGVAKGVSNASLSTTTGELGGAWASYTPTITVAGGTAPTYSAVDCKYSQIGKTISICVSLQNTSGGTAGAGTNPIYISLPVASAMTSRIGSGTAYNGGTTMFENLVLFDFLVVSDASNAIYLSGRGNNLLGNSQSNANRYIHFTATYEAA